MQFHQLTKSWMDGNKLNNITIDLATKKYIYHIYWYHVLVFIGDKMSKFCPEWIYSTFAAQTSKEFLSSNNSIAAISRKYSTAISERFNEVKFEEIMDLA